MFVQNSIDWFASTIAFKMTLMTILLRNEYLFKEKNCTFKILLTLQKTAYYIFIFNM